MTITGQADFVMTTADVSVTVQNSAPGFFFTGPFFSEVGVPIGGSGQTTIQSGANTTGQVGYSVNLALQGLPPGTTAVVSPNPIIPGQSITVTISADNSAPVSQNVPLSLVGTASAPVPQSSTHFLLDVTSPPGALPNNRTDYLGTEDTPQWAAYDPIHGLIFSVNNSWNRVDVISSVNRAIVKVIPIRDPVWVDLTPGDSTAWITTGSHQIFAVNTATLALTRFVLPTLTGPSPDTYWEGGPVYTLADGTLLILLQTRGTGIGGADPAIWDPTANTLTQLRPSPYISPGLIVKSGDGRRVYSIGDTGPGQSFYYDVPSKTFSGSIDVGGFVENAAVNYDGTRVAIFNDNGFNMYDGDLNSMGPFIGGAMQGFFVGGMVFGRNGLLYEESQPFGSPIIFTIDPNTLGVLNIAPALAIPAGDDTPSVAYPVPFDVDSTGIVLGIIEDGIAFDDSTFTQNLSPQEPGTPNFLDHMSPQVGPVAGGTASGGFGDAFSLKPDVWYGSNRGSAQILNGGLLQITSPPASAPGPVNVKMLFPDGIEVFDPLFFTYGPYIQTNILSGFSPDGGGTGQIAGYGLPTDNSSGTLLIGGAASPSLKPTSGDAPLIGGFPHGFPTAFVDYTVPAGSPGWADLVLHTLNGTSTLPRSLYYARSVKDYSSADMFSAVLYDSSRNQLYLSAGDHIDVFSLNANQFLTPLQPPAQGATKKFAGLSLSLDGSLLLATDLPDGSLAVINPDHPTSNFVIPIAPTITSGGNPGCPYGAIYVTPATNNQAFVLFGGDLTPACGPGGAMYKIDLTARTAAVPNLPATCRADGGSAFASTRDGTKVAFGGTSFNIYDVLQNTCGNGGFPQALGGVISADGNVGASQWVFTDSAAAVTGRVGLASLYFGSGFFPTNVQLQQPKLNDSGALYFLTYSHFIDIFDVQHGMLKMRFGLTETVSNVFAPMAIDSGGRQVFLITDKGLTIVDLGAALLSIGSLNPQTANAGQQVVIRGSGFTPSTTASIAGHSAPVSYTDENTLTLAVPAGLSGASDVTLDNGNGTTYTLENGLLVR